MRPTFAIVRVSVQSRVGVLGAVMAASCLARLTELGAWEGSDQQSVAAILLQCVLVPIFAAMLGGALVQGEHARWSWALARPVRRGHWAGVAIPLDAITLALSLAIIEVVVGAAPDSVRRDVLGVVLPDFRDLGAYRHAELVLAAVCYLGCAVGVARGRSSVRALPIAMVYALGSIVFTASLMWLDDLVARAFIVDAWPTAAAEPHIAVRRFGDYSRWSERYENLLIAAALLLGMGQLVGRALGSVPRGLSRGEVARVLAFWSVAAAAVSLSFGTRLAAVRDAPVLARRGDATVEIVIPQGVRSLALAQSDCDTCFERASPIWGRRDRFVATFHDVVPGRYRACVPFHPQFETSQVGYRPDLQACLDIDISSGPQRVQWRARDTFIRERPLNRSIAEELTRPFAGLPILRSTIKTLERRLGYDPRFGEPIFTPW
jgi:hypothetical protein